MDLERGFRNGRLVGHYLRILGFATLLSTVLGLIAGKGLTLDFTFILFLWMGGGLLQGREKFRKGVAILLTVYVAVALVIVVLMLVVPGGSERVIFQTPELAVLNMGLFLAFTGSPLALLTAPSTRRTYRSGTTPPAPQPLALRTIYYVLGTVVLASFPLLLERVTDRSVLALRTTSFAPARSGVGVVFLGMVESERTGTPHYIAWWAFADQERSGTTYDPGRQTYFRSAVGYRELDLAEVKPIRFLVGRTGRSKMTGNILLFRSDGSTERVPRVVTPETLAQAERAVAGATDLTEIRERLERALPPLAP